MCYCRFFIHSPLKLSWVPPRFGSDEQSCHRRLRQAFVRTVISSVTAGLCAESTLSFVRDCWALFGSGCTIVRILRQRIRVNCGAPFFSAFGVNRILDFIHSNWCVIVSHFTLYFSADLWGWTSFLFTTCIFFDETSVQVFGPSVYTL